VAAENWVKGWAILYQRTEGWPMMTLPKSTVPLLAVRMPVAVPVRAT